MACAEDLIAMTAERDQLQIDLAAAQDDLADMTDNYNTVRNERTDLLEQVSQLEADVARLEHRRILPENHGTFTCTDGNNDEFDYIVNSPAFRYNGTIYTAADLIADTNLQEILINLQSDIITLAP